MVSGDVRRCSEIFEICLNVQRFAEMFEEMRWWAEMFDDVKRCTEIFENEHRGSTLGLTVADIAGNERRLREND